MQGIDADRLGARVSVEPPKQGRSAKTPQLRGYEQGQ